jgi:Flp pilus assembly protein TadG
MTAALPMRDGRRLRGSEEGATAVESAIVLSAFVLLIFGIVQFGQVFWIYNTMMLAVEEAARYAMVYNSGPPSGGWSATGCTAASPTLTSCTKNAADRTLSACQVSAVNVPTPSTTSTTMTITANYTFNFIAPNILPYGPLSLQRQVTVPLD